MTRSPAAQAGAGRLDAPSRFLERVAGGGRISAGELAHDAYGTVAQLGVGWVEINHEVADDLAESNHRQGGENVQDELGGGAGFETRRAGQNLWSDIRRD